MRRSNPEFAPQKPLFDFPQSLTITNPFTKNLTLILLTLITLLPFPAHASTPSVSAQLQAAQQAAIAHDNAATFAKQRARADAEQAALLAEQQIEAAAKLRKLENQTGGAANDLARLQYQAAAAASALHTNEVALTALLPIMQRLSAAPAATILATPESSIDTVRGILILQQIAAEIETRSEAVKAQSSATASLLSQITAQQKLLFAAAATQRSAEESLQSQIAAARTAETADIDTAVAEAAAAVTANTKVQDLRGIIANLNAQRQTRAAPAAPIAVSAGANAPVSGFIIQNYGDPTIAGPAQGVTYKAAPGAEVVAPCAGPILFADHFQSYGLLVIVSCGTTTDFTLSGMTRLDVTPGQQIARGQPIGEMLNFSPKSPATEPHLYVELLQNGAPVNPAAWLTTGGSG